MVWRQVWMPAAILLISGCAGRHCHMPAVAPGHGPDCLPPGARGDFSADLQAVVGSLRGTLTTSPPYHAYRLLFARQCQCLAADASAQANIFNLEGQFTLQKADESVCHKKKIQEGADLKATALNYLALEDRNRSAAKALDLYYRLGEAEAGADILQATLVQVGDALEKARAIKAKGLQVPVDETALHRQHLDVQTQTIKLRLQIQQFNGELRRLLAFAPCDGDWQFWPAEAFHISPDCVEIEQAIAVGLSNRPILLLLDLLQTELNTGDPAIVRQMLTTINNMLGQDAQCPCLKKLLTILCGQEEERELRLQQLAVYRADREREVVEDIRHAVRAIHAQREALLLAHQKTQSWHARVKEFEEKEAKGLGAFTDTADARVNWLKARRAVAEEATNLQRAWVQLRQAQGVLPLECTQPATLHAPPAALGPAIESLPPPKSIMSK